VAGAVGLAAALRAAAVERSETAHRVQTLRDGLGSGLRERVEGLRTTAPLNGALPGHCHVVIRGVEAEELLLLLDREGLCASAGSACASGALEPSGVLAAMGVPIDEARGALRLSLGYSSSAADIEAALEIIPAAVERLRAAG
jgi:cysteine desulfurase